MAGEQQAAATKPAAGDNLLLLQLRWVLLLWILAMVGVHYEVEPWRFAGGLGLAGLFGLTQFLLWRLPAAWLKGLRLYTTVFLLDLCFVVGALFMAGQAEPRLLLVMFLTLFITALVQKPRLSVMVSVVVMAVYAGLRLQGGDSFGWEDARQLMDLPFLVITSLHASVIISEAGFHQEIMESLEADNASLSRKLGMSSQELKDRARFLAAAFDTVPTAVILLDPAGLIRVFNRQAEDLFKCRRGVVLDRTLRSVVFLEPLRQELARRSGEQLQQGLWLQDTHGDHFYALARNTLSRDEDGALLNFAVFLNLATPPAEAPTYEAWLALQKNLDDGVLQDSGAASTDLDDTVPVDDGAQPQP